MARAGGKGRNGRGLDITRNVCTTLARASLGPHRQNASPFLLPTNAEKTLSTQLFIFPFLFNTKDLYLLPTVKHCLWTETTLIKYVTPSSFIQASFAQLPLLRKVWGGAGKGELFGSSFTS